MLGETEYKAELPSGDLDAFLKDMNEEKAAYSASEDEGLDELYSNHSSFGSEETATDMDPSMGDGFAEEPSVISISPEMAALSADFAAMMTDLALPSLLALFVKCNPERLQATQDQYDKLVKAYSQYLQTKQIQMTPGWMLIGVIASIYATKIPSALKEQKLKEKEEELERREQELMRRLKELETQDANVE